MKFLNRKKFIILGLALALIGLFGCLEVWRQTQPQPAPFTTRIVSAAPKPVIPATPTYIEGDPAHLEVSSVNVSIDVIPGYYNARTQTWTSSITQAVFATMTAKPNNQTGGTFIYGHNRSSVFQRLLNAKIGDTAVVTTTNGHRFVYKLTSVHDTNPTDVSVLHYEGPPVLTLQTCSGVFYQYRRMFTFNLEQVS